MNNLTQYFPTECRSIVPPGRSLATSGDVVLFFTCRRCHRHLPGGDQGPPHPRTRAAPSAKPRPAPRASNAAAEHFQCGYSGYRAWQRTSQTVEPGSDHYFWHCCLPFCCYTCCPEERPPGEGGSLNTAAHPPGKEADTKGWLSFGWSSSGSKERSGQENCPEGQVCHQAATWMPQSRHLMSSSVKGVRHPAPASRADSGACFEPLHSLFCVTLGRPLNLCAVTPHVGMVTGRILLEDDPISAWPSGRRLLPASSWAAVRGPREPRLVFLPFLHAQGRRAVSRG